MSWVFLTADRAYKLKRPARFDFADMRSRTARADSCRHELRLNAELAAGIGIAVRSVVPRDTGYVLVADGDPEAIDHVIEMRRFDEAWTMRSRLERGTLTDAQVRTVGERIARFHRAADRAVCPPDEAARFAQNAAAVLELPGGARQARELAALQRFADAFLDAWSDVLAARVAAGCVLDGHGDLRTEHVLLDDEGKVLVVDRLDIDALRSVDAADELAFLAMDLEAHGGAALVAPLLDGYARAGGVPLPRTLVAYFTVYRAMVRAKVALLPGSADGAAAARQLLVLARAAAWRARGDMVVLVTGPPASGKSTLAAALSRVSGLPVLSSDQVRAETEAVGYSPGARASIYRELAKRVSAHRSVIVDATFGDPDLQAAFFGSLEADADRAVLAVVCAAPANARADRAAARAHSDRPSLSEAGPDVAEMLGERFVSVASPAVASRLRLDALQPIEDQLDAVEGWLDELLAG